MANKLLLIQDVEDLGRSGEIVSVKPGFARNYLLPQKLAVIADKQTLKTQSRLQKEREQKAEQDRQDAENIATQLIDLVLIKQVKIDHEGHMYGSVTSADLVNLIQEQKGITIEKRTISLKQPIKEIGVFEITLKLKEGVTSQITLKIIPEEAKQ